MSLTALAPEGTYFVRVRARNQAGVRPPSNEVRIIVGPLLPVPNAPQALGAQLEGRDVILRWVAPTGGSAVDDYILEAGSSTGLANLARVSVGQATTLRVANVPPGAYYVRVKARNRSGESAASNEVLVLVP